MSNYAEAERNETITVERLTFLFERCCLHILAFGKQKITSAPMNRPPQTVYGLDDEENLTFNMSRSIGRWQTAGKTSNPVYRVIVPKNASEKIKCLL